MSVVYVIVDDATLWRCASLRGSWPRVLSVSEGRAIVKSW